MMAIMCMITCNFPSPNKRRIKKKILAIFRSDLHLAKAKRHIYQCRPHWQSQFIFSM